ncbi:MAG: hypothetical protein LCI03_12925 [Actinobacteria bacterium]|nr:hypothetical protein [Actinomycetota bacterium]
MIPVVGAEAPRRRAAPAFWARGDDGAALLRVHDAALLTLEHNVVAGDEAPFLRAGGGYPDPWTRDAALNAWLAASLLMPDVARSTLLAVTEESEGGRVVAQDDQWWDQMVWAVAAHHHVLVTGDTEFLREAQGIAVRTLALREDHQRADGLFRGPAVMQDGISGYPRELLDPALEHDSFVLSHPRSHGVVCLSTNALHVLAYDAVAGMSALLGDDPARYRASADALRARTWAAFWNAGTGRLDYVVDPASGERFAYDEALGLALALLAGVVPAGTAGEVVRSLHRSSHGVVNVWPHTDGYTDARPSRHGAMCWPMVMGVWAWAVAATGDAASFGDDLLHLAHLLDSSDGLYELYDPVTGRPDGGWQALREWRSEPHQTWSASGYLGALLHGLVGLRPAADGLRFAPVVPAWASGAWLRDLPYRGARIDVTLAGEGAVLAEVRVDGEPVPVDAAVHVPAHAEGAVRVDLCCTPSRGSR